MKDPDGAVSAGHERAQSDYRIGPEDPSNSVFEDEKLNKTAWPLSITSSPRRGGEDLGHQLRGIRTWLKNITDPHVTVFIRIPQPAYLRHGGGGKTRNCRRRGSKTILDVLALVGGLKEDAGVLLFLIRPLTG
jgi:hypothetical protein